MATYREPLLDQWERNQPGPRDAARGTEVLTQGETTTNAFRQYTGFGAGTVEDNVPNRTPDFNWSNATNAEGYNSGMENPTGATLATSGAQPYVCSVLRFSNFGFSIPAGSTILGIECRVSLDLGSNDYDWNDISLAWGASAGTVSTNNNGTAAGALPSTPPQTNFGDIYNFGGPTDLWGETSATLLAQVNTTDFGFIFQPARNDSPATNSATIEVASVRMIVHYSVTEAGNARVTQQFADVVGTPGGTANNTRVSQSYVEVIASATEFVGARAQAPIVIT